MPEADRILLHTVARVVIVAERGDFEEQLLRQHDRKRIARRFRCQQHTAQISRTDRPHCRI